MLLFPNYLEDDISNLSSSFIPDFPEASPIRSGMTSRITEINAIDEEILYDHALSSVRAHRETLIKPNIAAEALLAPMRKLPAELLGDIFALTIPALSVERALKPIPQPFGEGEPYPHRMRLVLCQVCRQWNAVARNTPSLWSTLIIEDHRHLQDFAKGIVYSKRCSLDIYIGRYGWRVSGIPGLLRPEVGRIRQLILSTPHNDLSRLIPADEYAVAQRLEILAWSWDDPDSLSPLDTGIVRFDAPKLQFVALVDNPLTLKSFPVTSLRGLRQLHFLTPPHEQLSSHKYLGLLLHCPSLEELEIHHISGLWDYEEYDGVKVSLLSLKALVIGHSNDDDTILFIGNLHVPHLEELSLSLKTFPQYDEEGRWPIDPGLRSLLADARGSLRKIILEHLCLLGEEDVPLLSPLVNLDALEFKKCIIGNAILADLTPESASSTTWPCPQLSSLTFSDVRLSGDEFIRLVQYRTCPDNLVSPLNFTSIQVKNFHGMEDHHEDEFLRLAYDRSRTLKIHQPMIGSFSSSDTSSSYTSSEW